MAAFPTYVKLGLGSSLEPEQGWSDSISEAGTLHSIQKHSAQYYDITAVWPGTTGQLFNDISVLYLAGPRTTFTDFSYYLSSPSLVLSVKFLEPPRIIANHGGDKYDVRIRLRGWVA